MSCDLAVINASIPAGDRTRRAAILVDKGIVVGLVDDAAAFGARQTIDAKGMLTLPGCIDSHVHFMDPGFTHRETFATGSAGAAAGGITTVIDMPCCSVPSVRDVPSMNNKIRAIEPQAFVDFGLWGGATGEDVRDGRLDNVEAQADAGVVAFKAYMTPSVPSYPRSDDAELLEIFRAVARTGLPVGVHAENYQICDYNVRKMMQSGRLDGPAWAEARMELAEKVAIELCISLSEYSGARMHVVHMSTGIGAILIGEAKKRGLRVTSETCPHYLTLTAAQAMTERGAFAKIAPPLRTAEDNRLLWAGLASGAVDFVATDHAPYQPSTEKNAPGMNIWTSFPGIPGVETMVPVLVSEGYNKGRLSLSRLVEVLSTAAARHYGLYPKKGALEPGSDADITIIDTERHWTVDEATQQSLCGYTPLHGLRLKGKVSRTILRGRTVYDEGQFPLGAGAGRFVPRQSIMELPRTITFHVS
jgi:dihydropyrimidinase/allantoinase